MKVIIEAITDWEKDDAEIEEDRDHGGLSESDILLSLAGETKDKKESKWTKGLPFVWEHDVEIKVDDAEIKVDDAEIKIDAIVYIEHVIRSYLDDALSEYSDQYCADDYLKPAKFEGRIVA